MLDHADESAAVHRGAAKILGTKARGAAVLEMWVKAGHVVALARRKYEASPDSPASTTARNLVVNPPTSGE